VCNPLITIKPSVTPAELKEKIEDALVRNAEIDADRITVEVQGGQAILKGTVCSWAEREAAERAAWSAPGLPRWITGSRSNRRRGIEKLGVRWLMLLLPRLYNAIRRERQSVLCLFSQSRFILTGNCDEDVWVASISNCELERSGNS